MTPTERMEELRRHPAYGLDTGDWASQTAEVLISLLGMYADDTLDRPSDLPLPGGGGGGGMMDPVEAYARE